MARRGDSSWPASTGHDELAQCEAVVQDNGGRVLLVLCASEGDRTTGDAAAMRGPLPKGRIKTPIERLANSLIFFSESKRIL
jgi:hypothetical protein